MKLTKDTAYEAVSDNEIELKEQSDNSGQSNKTEYKKLDNQDEDQIGVADVVKTVKVSCFKRCRGFILVCIGGVVISFVGATAKHLKHIPLGEYIFMQYLMTSLIMAPLTCFFLPRIDCCGKMRWIMARCVIGGIAGVIKILGYIRLDFGDAVAMFATTPIFAGIFARIMLKEKINIFTLISAILGIAGTLLIAKPSFIFGGSEKGYSWFTLVIIFGAVCLGFAYTTLRKIGSEVHYLVIPFILNIVLVCFSTIISLVFIFIERKELVAPGCYQDRIIMFFACGGRVIAYICINRGMAIERTGPVTLMRNLDIVYAYIIQISFFKKDPELESFVGAALILFGTLLITLNKLFFRKLNFCEI